MNARIRDLLSPNRPWLHLVYLGLFFFRWIYSPPGLPEAAVSFGVMAVFIAAYVFVMRRLDWTVYAFAAVSTAVGFAFVPTNMGGAVYVIFAGAMLARLPASRARLVALVILAAVAGGVTWALSMPVLFLVSLYLFGGMAVGGSLMAAHRERAEDQVEERQAMAASLGAEAERQRIARDLHDLLGHTLSVVTLKADLASRLFDTDPDRARNELAEIQDISRQALAEVREAVTGLRERGFRASLEETVSRLESAGLKVTHETAPAPLSRENANVLAMTLREASTNILRHAGASEVRIESRIDGVDCVLTIADNGQGGADPAGGGLSGLKERVTQAGGNLTITPADQTGGTCLSVRLPQASKDGSDD